MATPSSSSQPGLPEIWLELQALRLEVAELRRCLNGRPDADDPGPEPGGVGGHPDRQADRQASAATLLMRRNGERLQAEVRRRLASAASQVDGNHDLGANTEVDLLIDRLHDLADASSECP